MATKPFSLQSPEQIAKDYGGNKQKIAQAAQSGLLDPTAAVMAGMFIDRMRSAQTQEQGPPTTVAQQVFAPPQPPQGAPPPMMGQPGMAPPMGAPMPPPPPAAPPMGAPPVGMASGGLTALPLPDNMFDEPDGMGYAGGGIVAFAQGAAVQEDDDELTLGDRLREQFRGPEDPTYYGPPVTAADMRKTFGIPDDPSYVPFLGAETGVAKLAAAPLIGAVRATAGMMRRGGDESFARQQYEKAMAQYRRDRAAYDAAAATNMRVAAIGGGKQQPKPPKPVMPKRQDFEAADFAAPRGAPPAAKPAVRAAAPASTARPAPSGMQDPAYRGPPVTADAMRAMLTKPAPPAPAPRVGGPTSAPRAAMPAPAPRAAMPAPAGPPLPASPAAPAAPGAEKTFGGFSPTDIAGNAASIRDLAPVSTAARDAMAKHYADMSSPEALAAQKKQDFWGSLAQIGFGMAGSNSPHFLQAVGQSASAALPGMQQAAQARRARVNEGMRGQLDLESLSNKEQAEIRSLAMQMTMQSATAGQSAEEFQKTYQLNYTKVMADIAEGKERNAISRAALAQRGSGGGGGEATGVKPLTRAQALVLVNSDPKMLRATPEQKLARADGLVAQSSGAAPASAANYNYVNGKLVPTNR